MRDNQPSRAIVLMAMTLVGACAGQSAPIPLCSQDARREALPPELVAYLPTIGRPNAREASDRLIADATVALAGREPYALPADPTWKEDPFGDPTWVYEYLSLFMVMDALTTYQATSEDAYLDLAESILTLWLDEHLTPAFRASWGDHIMANRTRILLLAWELLRAREPDSPVVDGLCRQLAVHGDHLAREEEYTANHNHGFFQDEALLAVSLALEQHPRSLEWTALAKERLAQQIEFAVTNEGVHREHSPSYHAGMQARFGCLSRLLEALDQPLRIDLVATMRSMFEFMAFGVLPTRRAPLIGDSSNWFGSPNSPMITDEAQYSLSQGQDGVAPSEVDRVFFESGYAFFRDAWHPAETFEQTIYVAFVAAVFSRTHKHGDDLSVLLYGYGEQWLTDTGIWSYDKDDHYTFLALSTAGHNVVEVDGKSYASAYPKRPTKESGFQLLTEFDLGVETSSVQGEHSLNEGVRYHRDVLYTRPADLLVTDTLVAEDGKNHDYVLRWHVAHDKTVAKTGSAQFAVSSESGATMALSIAASTDLACEVIKGATDPYQGWYFPSFLEVVEAPVIACSTRARDAEIVTTISLSP